MSKARLLWRKVHLWLGLAAGAWIALLGISGSILVYHDTLDRQLNARLLTCPQSQADVSLDQAHSVLRTFFSDASRYSLYRGVGETAAWHAYIPHPQDSAEALEILFCPYPGEILGTRGWATGELSRTNVMSWAYSLHYSLLLRGAYWGNTGQYLVGAFGLALVFSLLSGAVLWWPRGGKWRQAIWLKSGARGIRHTFDLHRVFGYLSLLPLLVISISGVQMAFSGWLNPMIHRVAPLHNHQLEDPALESADHKLHSLDKLYEIAQAVFPDAQFNGVRPSDGTSAISFIFRQADEPRAKLGTSRVWLDPRTGQVLQVRDPLAGSSGDDVLEWMFPLHNGEALGQLGRLMVFMAGLTPLVLFLTGVTVWSHKRRKRRSPKLPSAVRGSDSMKGQLAFQKNHK